MQSNPCRYMGLHGTLKNGHQHIHSPISYTPDFRYSSPFLTNRVHTESNELNCKWVSAVRTTYRNNRPFRIWNIRLFTVCSKFSVSLHYALWRIGTLGFGYGSKWYADSLSFTLSLSLSLAVCLSLSLFVPRLFDAQIKHIKCNIFICALQEQCNGELIFRISPSFHFSRRLSSSFIFV